MKFKNKNHQALFNTAANKLNRHDKTKMAILYLLTADVRLWNMAKRHVRKGYIDLDGIDLGNKGYPKAYTLLGVAKDIACGTCYGVRRSEVLGIKWSAIDEDEGLIHLRHKIIEDKANGRTVIRGMDIMKSKSSMRSLPLIDFIREELRKERERQEEMKKVLRGSYNRKYEEYVCVDAMGNLFKPNYVTNHFAVILKEHGLEKIRFHDLRHSCATLMLSNGEDLKKIQGWLGHSTITITADTYAHLDAHSKRGSASVIENALSFTA